jgi:hypothetical protein
VGAFCYPFRVHDLIGHFASRQRLLALTSTDLPFPLLSYLTCYVITDSVEKEPVLDVYVPHRQPAIQILELLMKFPMSF